MSHTPPYDYHPDEPFLNNIEARVLGSLIEKQMTTPDYYPLTRKALITACNQKSSREPVMSLSEGELAASLQGLRTRGLITANTLARADRYEQQLTRKLGLKSRQRAVIAVLLLRGGQTLNEIRIRTERMVAFDDNDAVLATLQQMTVLEPPLVVQLPRVPGQREGRFMHLLCGRANHAPATPQTTDSSTDVAARVHKAPSDNGRLGELEAEVCRLRRELDLLWKASGLQRPAEHRKNDPAQE